MAQSLNIHHVNRKSLLTDYIMIQAYKRSGGLSIPPRFTASLFIWINLMAISTEISLSNGKISSSPGFQSIGAVRENTLVMESLEVENEPLSWRYFGSLTVVYIWISSSIHMCTYTCTHKPILRKQDIKKKNEPPSPLIQSNTYQEIPFHGTKIAVDRIKKIHGRCRL
jgi:hypothetical protein